MKNRKLRKKCDTLMDSIVSEIKLSHSAHELERLCYTCDYLIDKVVPLLLYEFTPPEELEKIKSDYRNKYRTARDFCINYKFSPRP